MSEKTYPWYDSLWLRSYVKVKGKNSDTWAEIFAVPELQGLGRSESGPSAYSLADLIKK